MPYLSPSPPFKSMEIRQEGFLLSQKRDLKQLRWTVPSYFLFSPLIKQAWGKFLHHLQMSNHRNLTTTTCVAPNRHFYLVPRFLFLPCCWLLAVLAGRPTYPAAEWTCSCNKQREGGAWCVQPTQSPFQGGFCHLFSCLFSQLLQGKCQFATGCGDRKRLIFEPQHKTQLLQYLTLLEASPCWGKELGLAVEWWAWEDQHKPDAVPAKRQRTDVVGGWHQTSHNALCKKQVTNVGQGRWFVTPPLLSKLILCHGMSGYGSLTGLSCVPGFSVGAAAWAEISRAEDFLLADARRTGVA